MRDHVDGFSEKELFLRLDQRFQGKIDAEDIKNFMLTRGTDCDLSQALAFLSVYDVDKDCCLSIEEFIRAVTPSNLEYNSEYYKLKAL
jgi:Ca2+-binding EF-hand superfamily protein